MQRSTVSLVAQGCMMTIGFAVAGIRPGPRDRVIGWSQDAPRG